MNINMDYSFLFSNTTSGMGSSGAASSFLSDYASIKNGSYRKLMKAYYAKNNAESSNTKTTVKGTPETKNLASIQEDTNALKKSSEALTTKGSKNLFRQKEVTKKNDDGTTTTSMDYDRSAIYKGVKAFVDDYNSVIDSGAEANSTKLLRQTLNLTKTTKAFSNLLSDVGITVGKGNHLEINEDTFKGADMNSVKALFNGSNSYAGNIASQASMLGSSAGTEAAKANTYNAGGSYNNSFNAGNIYSSYF